MFNRFTDKEGIAKHQASEPYNALLVQANEEKLLKGPLESKMIIPCSGFEGR
jgi:hypothetical protein